MPRKSKSKSAQKRKRSTNSMVEKIQIEKTINPRSTNSMILGMTLISLGLLVLVIGVILFFLYRREPQVDRSMSVPTVDETASASNARSIVLSGEAEGAQRVMVYLNGKILERNLKVDEGKFRYEYDFSDEGEYKFQAATVTGFPVRVRSELSQERVVAVDWSAPSSENVSLVYEKEIHDGAFSVAGTIDPNTTVVLKRGDNRYVAKSDDKGAFELKDVPLSGGENKFEVELRDEAGNKTVLDKGVTVAMRGDINGNGVTDIPEASGELSNALAYLAGNNAMKVFGLIAFALFAVNSTLVVLKVRSDLA